LIKDISNLKGIPSEKIKDFNSRFNKLLNKIPYTSKPSADVQNEWYISSLPSNIAFFVDRANKMTLGENMKEALAFEKRIIDLENKTTSVEGKTKRFNLKKNKNRKLLKIPLILKDYKKS